MTKQTSPVTVETVPGEPDPHGRRCWERILARSFLVIYIGGALAVVTFSVVVGTPLSTLRLRTSEFEIRIPMEVLLILPITAALAWRYEYVWGKILAVQGLLTTIIALEPGGVAVAMSAHPLWWKIVTIGLFVLSGLVPLSAGLLLVRSWEKKFLIK